MAKLTDCQTKTLKLQNMVSFEVNGEKFEKLNINLEQMESYIRAKGAVPIGPLIQYANVMIDEQGQAQLQMKMIRQCNNLIHSVELPYEVKPVIRVKNCMYVIWDRRKN